MKISFMQGVRSGEELVLASPVITVGRESDNLVELPTESVSRYHGRFRREGERWLLEDLGSTNGIKLNGVKLTAPGELHEGDLVTFGDQLLRLTELASQAQPVIFTPLTSPDPVPVAAEPVTPPVTAEPVTSQVGSAPAAAEPVPPPAEDAPSPTDLKSVLLQHGGKLFGDQKKRSRGGAEPGAGNRRIFSNRVFFTVTISVLVILVAVTYKLMSGNATATVEPNATAPAFDVGRFLLRYEKELAGDDNVFYFLLSIENGGAVFLIDDLQSGRHYRKEIKQISQSHLEELHHAVSSSGILELEPQPEGAAVNNQQNRRVLTVAQDGRLNRVEIINNFAPKAFEDIEFAINGFADYYGMQTIALTPEQLRQQAIDNFNKAEDLFANREAELGNLPKAIRRYQVAVGYLEQFSPKPELWDRARKRLEEAERLRKQALEELERERIRCSNFRDFNQMRQVFLKTMELTDPDSREYDLARTRLLKLDSYLNQPRRK